MFFDQKPTGWLIDSLSNGVLRCRQKDKNLYFEKEKLDGTGAFSGEKSYNAASFFQELIKENIKTKGFQYENRLFFLTDKKEGKEKEDDWVHLKMIGGWER